MIHLSCPTPSYLWTEKVLAHVPVLFYILRPLLTAERHSRGTLGGGAGRRRARRCAPKIRQADRGTPRAAGGAPGGASPPFRPPRKRTGFPGAPRDGTRNPVSSRRRLRPGRASQA